MRMIIPTIGVETVLVENQGLDIVIENPFYFSSVVQDLLSQYQGNFGETAIVDGASAISLIKEGIVILDPFSLDCNEKKIINKVYQELANDINESLIDEYIELCARNVSFVDKVIARSPYNLDMESDCEIVSLLKTYSVGISVDDSSLLEKVINYLKIVSSVLHTRIVFFINFKLFFSQEEYFQLCEFCLYNKIYIVNITGSHTYKLDTERTLVVDEDLCVIEL